jgi:hypothetical protein
VVVFGVGQVRTYGSDQDAAAARGSLRQKSREVNRG